MALTKTDATAPSVVTLMPAVGSREINARIDEANVSHIIGRLTKLYNNPVHATVRETVSNATDASAGLDAFTRKPVEISTPNPLQKTFVVRDHGVGMSAKDVEDIYANYGASTKSADVESIGSYGLGGKAPLAYTTAFEVTTTKDGITTSFIMARSGGETKTTIRSVQETGLPAGTEVRIPVESYDTSKFEEAINFYKNHSHTVPVMIDGETYNGNEDYYLAGAAEIFKDQDGALYGNVYIRRDALSAYFNGIANYGMNNSDISYSLSGWLYSADGTSRINLEPKVVVELIPALVNFGSSRDAITDDEKLDALNKKIEEALRSPQFIENGLKLVRAFSRPELAQFLKTNENDFSIAEDQKSFRLGRGTYGKAIYEGEIDLLKSEMGFNAFLFHKLDVKPSATISLTMGSQETMGYITGKTSKNVTGLSIDSTNRTGEVIARFLIPELTNALSVTKLATRYMGDELSIFIVTGTDEPTFRSLLRNRKALFAGGRKNFIFVFTNLAKTNPAVKADFKQAELIAGEKVVNITSAQELLAFIKPDVEYERKTRKVERGEREQAALSEQRYFVSPQIDSFTDVVKVQSTYATRSNRTTFQEVFDSGAILFIGEQWRTAYVGAVNAGEDLIGKTIVVYDKKLTATEATQLLTYKHRIYFTDRAKLSTTATKTLAEGRVFHATVLNSVLGGLSLSELVHGMNSYNFHSIDYKAMAQLAPYLDQEDAVLMEVFNAFVLSSDVKTYVGGAEASVELESRFGSEYSTALKVIHNGLMESIRQYTVDNLMVKLVIENARKSAIEITPMIDEVFKFVANNIAMKRAAQEN